MSSGSSGRYQSRLFNFVHQQSRRLTEQWEHTFRHLQVASKWGVELLLYPVYLLFNSTASAGKTLGTQEPQSRPQLQPNDTDFEPITPPSADTPIQHVLEAVKNLSSESATTKPSITSNPFKFLGVLWSKFFHHPPTHPIPAPSLKISHNSATSIKHHLPVVQGIATNLLNRNLVLVTADNEILDILTPQQQAKLKARIISEIGNYWHSWQLAETKQQTKLLPEIDRILAKLTGGNTVLPDKTPKDLFHPHRLIAFLDESIAKLETNALLPIQQHSQEIIRAAQTQLDIFLYGKEQVDARGKVVVTVNSLETQTLNFSALIEAALNYFFGVNKGHKIKSKNSDGQSRSQLPHHRRFQSLPKSTQLQNEDSARDPWLKLSDLFGKSDTVADKPASSQNLTVKKPKAKSVLSPRQQNNTEISVKHSLTRTSQAITESCQNTQVEVQPDWIDVEAIFIGYDRHPLEKILEWLDHAMLWLEEIFVKVFHWLQRLWRGQ
ncbi:MAG: hypothetical protein KME59_03495 [Trichormus sp. ATA11-4-KO1]|jgi:hypothetical protein|nr:hypothetical protein [Trichormus sp. ATA11-4-KO1]